MSLRKTSLERRLTEVDKRRCKDGHFRPKLDVYKTHFKMSFRCLLNVFVSAGIIFLINKNVMVQFLIMQQLFMLDSIKTF